LLLLLFLLSLLLLSLVLLLLQNKFNITSLIPNRRKFLTSACKYMNISFTSGQYHLTEMHWTLCEE
jgi:hypothetical protein